MEIFDIVSLLIGAVSLIVGVVGLAYAIVVRAKSAAIEKAVLANAKCLLNETDLLCYAINNSNMDKEALLYMAKQIRTHTTAIIEFVPGKKERLRGFDYGIEGETVEERIQNRKICLGIDKDGCIIAGQCVALSNGDICPIEQCEAGQKILACDISSFTNKEAVLTRINRYQVKNFIKVNNDLCLTAEHKVFVMDRGWTCCYDLTIGDAIRKLDGELERIDSLELIEQQSECFSVHITPYECVYVNRYLVHNEEDEGK